MRVSDFDYDLPPDLIAQEPPPRRDASRLMTLDRTSGRVEHRAFGDLPDLLRPGDLLVLNDTRVVPARLRGRRAAPGTGGAVEVLLLERAAGACGAGSTASTVGAVDRVPPPGPVAGRRSTRAPFSETQVWRALMKGTRRPSDPLSLGSGLTAVLLERDGEETFLVELRPPPGVPLERALEEAGEMPTPPYIRRSPGEVRLGLDRDRYQTVFARAAGAVAAPTAGLHFTPELLQAVRGRGVEVETLTLHVGLGTFQPVRGERVEDHRLHAEAFDLPARLAGAVVETRRRGGRVVAVGTTVTRTLEARSGPEPGTVLAGGGLCDLFIRPGHAFRVVDALLTNFHLPRSTLLMLVAAFAGREPVLGAYREAVARRYRFYSYGDAMLLA